MRTLKPLFAAVAAVLACGAAHAAVAQAYVHTDGSDGNAGSGCPVDRPCRTFDAALSVTDLGGDVIALDSGDFGAARIRQSVSIIGNGAAGIVVPSGGIGVDIRAPGANVALRGLSINGAGVGSMGVFMKEGTSLHIEKCVLSNNFGSGVEVLAPASVRIIDSVMRGNSNGAYIHGGATVDVTRSQFIGNRGMGLTVQADTAGTTSAVVSDSVASSNGLTGFFVGSGDKYGLGRMVVTGSTAAHNRQAGFLSSASDGNAVMTVGRSTAARNGIGFAQFPGVSGTSSLETMGDNSVRYNGTASSGLVVAVPPM